MPSDSGRQVIWRDVDGEQRLLMNPQRCAQRGASFLAMGPGRLLEIIETLHTTCTAALAACVCTSEDDKKIERVSRVAFEVASVAALTMFVLVFALISKSRTQFMELRVYFTAV